MIAMLRQPEGATVDEVAGRDSSELARRGEVARLGTKRDFSCFPSGRCDSAECAVLAEVWLCQFAPGMRACAARNALFSHPFGPAWGFPKQTVRVVCRLSQKPPLIRRG